MLCPRCHREFEDVTEGLCPFDGEPLTNVAEIELVSSRPTPERGAVYGKRYMVRGLLGQGGMAHVYLAEDVFSQRLAAIKVLSNPDARAKNAKQRFFREMRTTQALAHPNIVRSLDAGQRRDGSPYLIMEYLYGESLGERLRRERRVELGEALWIARQAASALSMAHGAGVIHRDVKPDNVFLVGELGKPYAVKILDFGFARLQGQSGFTAMGVTVGTLEYMAPEQTVKDNTGPRTDMYALGVILYRMITGSLPFTGSEPEVLAQQLIAPPLRPSALLPQLDPRVERLILTTLRKLPRNRYPSMEDLLVDIDRVLDDASSDVGVPLWEDDIYVPQAPYARNVAAFLYKKLGRTPPEW
jgi:serine/threonine protein kinase